MKYQTLQSIIWLVFLFGYSVYKYLAGLQTWNTGYAIQVVIIVALTAAIPYYITKFVVGRQSINIAIGTSLIMPTVLAVLGYGVFFVLFIQKNFPDMTAMQVLPRGLLPGACMSIILGGGLFWSRTHANADPKVESEE